MAWSKSATLSRPGRTENASLFGDCEQTIEAAVSRYKWVIGDALRSRTDRRQATEVAIAVRALNRMLDLGRTESVRIA